MQHAASTGAQTAQAAVVHARHIAQSMTTAAQRHGQQQHATPENEWKH